MSEELTSTSSRVSRRKSKSQRLDRLLQGPSQYQSSAVNDIISSFPRPSKTNSILSMDSVTTIFDSGADEVCTTKQLLPIPSKQQPLPIKQCGLVETHGKLRSAYKWVQKHSKAPSESIRNRPNKKIEEIVDHRERKKGLIEYKVRFEGYPASCAAWVTSDRLNCEDLISNYLQKIWAKGASVALPESAIMPIGPSSEERPFNKDAEVSALFTEEMTLEIESEPGFRLDALRMLASDDELLNDIQIVENKIETDVHAAARSSVESQAETLELLVPRREEKSVVEMNPAELRFFLIKSGYADEAERLFDENFDGKQFLNVTGTRQLQKLGIRLGPCLKIFKLIIGLREKIQAEMAICSTGKVDVLSEPEVIVPFVENVTANEMPGPEVVSETQQDNPEGRIIIDVRRPFKRSRFACNDETLYSFCGPNSQIFATSNPQLEAKKEKIETEIVESLELNVELPPEQVQQFQELNPSPSPEKSVQEMNSEELRAFLIKSGFGEAAEKLFEKHYDGRELLKCKNVAELQQCSLRLGHSLKIWGLVRALRQKVIQPSLL